MFSAGPGRGATRSRFTEMTFGPASGDAADSGAVTVCDEDSVTGAAADAPGNGDAVGTGSDAVGTGGPGVVVGRGSDAVGTASDAVGSGEAGATVGRGTDADGSGGIGSAPAAMPPAVAITALATRTA